jgi:5-methylcytosine-specific restriction enzyme subunit McrC
MTPVLRLVERRPREMRLPASVVAELLAVAPKRFEVLPTHRRGVYRLTSQGLVGELRLSRLSILIRPKIPLTNLAFLMGFTPPPDWSVNQDDPNCFDLVAVRLAELIRDRLREGLVKRYVEATDRQPFIKGRLDVAAQLRDPSPLVHQFQCEFETLTEDHAFHQIPKRAAERLLKSAPLSPAIRHALDAAVAELRSISSPEAATVRDLPEPCPPGYESLIELSRWILEGSTPSPVFLLDLERLFERFLARRLAESLSGTPLRGVTGRRIVLPSASKDHADLELFPDLLVQRSAETVSVLDAKWKRLGGLPEADDVQQVIAYGATEGVREVRLIYPGKRFATRTYRLPASGMNLLAQTVRIVGDAKTCEASWRRFVRSVVASGHEPKNPAD